MHEGAVLDQVGLTLCQRNSPLFRRDSEIRLTAFSIWHKLCPGDGVVISQAVSQQDGTLLIGTDVALILPVDGLDRFRGFAFVGGDGKFGARFFRRLAFLLFQADDGDFCEAFFELGRAKFVRHA